MSKLVKRIEKEFFLKIVYDEKLPLTYNKDRAEYTLHLKAPPKESLIFTMAQPIDGLCVSSKISLMFNYRGDSMLFDVTVLDIRDKDIVCNVPESIRKNLDRGHMRVNLPSQIQVHVSFFSDRYNLPFPRLRQYNPALGSLATLQSLKKQVEALAATHEYGYKMTIFAKDVELSVTEEQVLAHTGKVLFIADTRHGLPQTDPYNRGNRIVTEDVFNRYLLEAKGIEGRAAETAFNRFVQDKANSGVVSDAWVPIIFQEYTVGYLRMWSGNAKKPPMDFMMLDTLHKYAEAMSLLLKEKGYFDKMKMDNTPFIADVQDISVSGLLFTCPIPDISLKLMQGCDLKVTVANLRRSLDIKATVTRQYREKGTFFVGCQFKDMNIDDIQYLFESIYAKPFTETRAPR